jgi:hypothetical protein
LRLKRPSERRPGLPRVNPWVFWPGFAWETLRKYADLAHAIWRLARLRRAIERDPVAYSYMDPALSPVLEDDNGTLDLLTKTTGARAALARAQRGLHHHPLASC